MAAPMARRRTAIAAALFAAAIAAIGGAGRGASGAFAVAAPKSLKVTGGVRNWLGNVDENYGLW